MTFESPSEQNKLGERIEQHSPDETAIGTISPGGLQKQESSSAAEQKTTSTDEVPLILPLLYEKLGEGKFVSSKGSDDGSNEANYGDSDHKDSENSDQDDVYGKNSMLLFYSSILRIGTFEALYFTYLI